MVHAMEPLPPPIHHLPLTCHRHPHVDFTGFCSSCLRERLQTLDSSSSTNTFTTHRNSTSTISSSLKSIFFLKEQQEKLRRCKSTPLEPRRKSPDEIAPLEVEERPMRDFIELESQIKKPPPPPRSFWNKIQKWRSKKKVKKMEGNEHNEQTDQKSSSTRFKEARSEVAVDAFGRRSCDIDRRLSLDAGRILFDEHRPSWDGYLTGSRSILHRTLSHRIDGQIPVAEDSKFPGGTEQTKIYYFDSSSRSRRRSLDRSNSLKKLDFGATQVCNAKVSPAGSSEFFRDWTSIYSRDDRSESCKLNSRQKSKRQRKAWSIWGLIHRRSDTSNSTRSRGGGGRGDNGNVAETALSNGHLSNGRTLRRNSSVSSRSSIYGNLNGIEIGGLGKKTSDGFVLERNRSARYESPGNIDNGMLRFHLTPMRGDRRGSGKGSGLYQVPRE